jgi:hypothetical protein
VLVAKSQLLLKMTRDESMQSVWPLIKVDSKFSSFSKGNGRLVPTVLLHLANPPTRGTNSVASDPSGLVTAEFNCADSIK